MALTADDVALILGEVAFFGDYVAFKLHDVSIIYPVIYNVRLHTKDEALDKFKVFKTEVKLQQGSQIKRFRIDRGEIDYFNTYALVARISTIRVLIAMALVHNLIIHQMDVKTPFLNDELDGEVNMNQPQGFIMYDNENNMFLMEDTGEANVILGITVKHESNMIAISQFHYIEKLLKKFNYFDCTPVSTHTDISEKLMPNNGQTVFQLEYSRVIGCIMYVMTCTRPDIAFAVGYTDANWTSNTKDNSSTSGWVFLLGGSAISWASKKQTCITRSTMESKFVSLAAVGKEAYSQMYNGKSRHLGVKHSMIRELITNGVVSIEFVRCQRNFADHLMKGVITGKISRVQRKASHNAYWHDCKFKYV
nr:zinc finger, CCHC-type [Tanacetum cinerariifolium]